MANIQRLVNNICNHSTEARKVFESISEKANRHIDELSAHTPIPNQVFSSRYNRLRRFSQLIFSENAYEMLRTIQDVDHICTSLRASANKSSGDIKFACFGYRDFDGDIIITEISCPILEEARKMNFNDDRDFFDFIATTTSSADFKLEAPSRMYDYLRIKKFGSLPKGDAIVGLIGHTKHDTQSTQTNNCFKLSELAEAVIPQTTIKADCIMSGAIAITPKTINSSKLYSNKNKSSIDDALEYGSLECALISYEKNPNTQTVTPTNIEDMKRAIGIINPKEHNLKISSSSQPIDKLYIAKELSSKDYSM